MAIQATHIRFSLDLKDQLGVLDLKKYVAGSVYPDSRYMTGVVRTLTHPKDFLESDFFKKTADDFRKGWFAHLLCDTIQSAIVRETLPEICEAIPGKGTESRWVLHSGMKVLQDMDDITHYDIKEYLPFLDYTENPNQEDVRKIRAYNAVCQKMYASPEKMFLQHYRDMWQTWNVEPVLVEQIAAAVEMYAQDARIMHIMRQIYPESVRRAKHFFENRAAAV